MLLGAEFLAMILVVVYVGAIAVLFLFVVMMLDVDFTAPAPGFRPLPADRRGGRRRFDRRDDHGVASSVASHGAAAASTGPAPSATGFSNAGAIGAVLYTDYVYLFQAAGMVLLVAMIGAIVLTLKHRGGIRRQNIGDQVARDTKSGMQMVEIKPGAGIEL